MKLLNSIHEDYHMHSLNFSDGMCTIEEIVRFAGERWLKKIAITDHSQAALDVGGIIRISWIPIFSRRKNILNDVEVIQGIEWDLLNEKWDCCFDIQWFSSDFLILSCHEEVYEAHHGDFNKLTEAYLNALDRYHDKIKFIGHLCKKKTVEFVNVEKIVEKANFYKIPLEFNAGYFHREGTDLEKLDLMLSLADQVYVNSDAHSLYELTIRQGAFDYLKKKWFIQ